ncbi:MAG: hypothetical protein AMXMBFR13_08450 [Phycisphaerae bacterium]
MRSDRFVLPMLAAMLMLAAPTANGMPGAVYDSQGTTTLTQDGWTLAGTPSDQFTKSKDYSTGQLDGGTNGVWNINDNNTGPNGNAYMRMWKDPGPDNPGAPGGGGLGGIDQSQGMVMARVRYISGSSTNGTFGYSSAAGNHSVMVAVRNGVLAFKSAEQDSTDAPNVNVDTSVYRVYAIQYGLGGVFDAWYSTTSNWSSNASDWVQVVNDGTWSAGQNALVDETGAARSGLVMGATGSSGNTWNGNIDWIAWSKFGDHQLPWTYPAPEPATLALLALGALPLLRRRL